MIKGSLEPSLLFPFFFLGGGGGGQEKEAGFDTRLRDDLTTNKY